MHEQLQCTKRMNAAVTSFRKELRRIETDFTTAFTYLSRMPLRQDATVCLMMSLNSPRIRREETRSAGGQGYSGALKACLELEKAESGHLKVMKRGN
jgi:hypothetical protein